MLDHQVLALHSLEDNLRGKLSPHLGHVIDHLVQNELLDVNSEEYDLLQHHGMLTSRQRVSELLKQLCQLSGEKGKSAFDKFMHALREIGFSAEAKVIEETSDLMSANGEAYPETGLQWKSSYMFKSHAPSITLPSPRPVRDCVEVYRNHLLSICREQRWRSLLPEIRTPGADIGDWFVSVQALSNWQAMQGSAANQSDARAAQLGEGFSVSEPVQLLMQFPHLYESAMDVDEIEFVKSCMVLSSAGTGKTTLCRRLLANYSTRATLLQEKFPFPVYIQCGDVDRLNTTDWETVLGVNDADLRAELSEAECKLVVEYLLGHAQDLLLIVDGVDEVRQGEFAVNGSKLSGVLCQDRKALKKASLFMTSRSCAAASSLVPQCASLYALAGFTEEQLEQYMAKRLGCDQGRQCMEALCDVSLSHVKEAILAVPLFSALVAEEYRRAGAIPLNVTSLYGGYLQHAERRWRDRCDKKTVAMERKVLHEPATGKGDGRGTSDEDVPCASDDHHLHSRPAAKQECSRQRRPPTIAEKHGRDARIPFVSSLYRGHLRHAPLPRMAATNPRASPVTNELDGSAIADSDVRTCSEHSRAPWERRCHHSRSAAHHDTKRSPPHHPPKGLRAPLAAKALEMLSQRQRSSSVAFFTPEVADFGQAIGVLSSGATMLRAVAGEAVEFNHVSYQEYLAADNVSRDPSPVEAAKQCLERIGVGEETWPFWQFLCGLVDSHHLLGILSLLKDGQRGVALPKKLTCFLMLCLLENQSQSKTRSAHTEAAEAMFGQVLDLSYYQLSKLETVGLANALRLLEVVPCEELNLTSCAISCAQVKLLGDRLPLIRTIDLSGNNLHGGPLKSVASAFRRAHPADSAVLNLDKCKLSEDDGVSIACLMQFTQSLSLDYMDPSALPVIAASMVPSPNLGELYLRECKLPGGSGADICQILKLAPSLTDLCLSCNILSTDDADQLLTQLSGSQIRNVRLENNSIDGDITTSLITLLRAIDHRPPCEDIDDSPSCTVYLEGNDVPHSCLVSVLDAGCGVQGTVGIGAYYLQSGDIHPVDCVRQLEGGQDLCEAGVNDAMVSEVAAFMAQDTSVSELDLADNLISDEGAHCLAASLKTNSTLRILDLDHNRVSISGLLALLEGMSTVPPLPRALLLSRCPVFHSLSPSHPDLKSLLRPFRYHNLRVLLLADTGLNSDVGILIAEALQWNRSLAMIGLCENALDDKFASALAQSLEDNITLQEVLLTNNQITEVGVQQMTQSRGIHRLQRVWMHGNPCDPRRYRRPLVNASWVGTSDDLKQFLQN